MEAAMLLKMVTTKRARKPQETVASGSTEANNKTKYACVVEAHEPTRKRFQLTLPRNPELVVLLLLPRLVLFWFVLSSLECCTLAGGPGSSRIISSRRRSYSLEVETRKEDGTIETGFRGARSPKHKCIWQIAHEATLSWMTVATRYPVVACRLIWEKCGDMAAPRVRTGQ